MTNTPRFETSPAVGPAGQNRSAVARRVAGGLSRVGLMEEGELSRAESPGRSGLQDAEPPEEIWPFVAGRRLIFLLDASSGIERRILRRWIETNRPESISPGSCELIDIPPSRRQRRAQKLDPRLQACLAIGGDPLLAPFRGAWLPAGTHRGREARFRDLLTPRGPRAPGRL